MALTIVATVAFLTELAGAVTCQSPALKIDTLVTPGTDPHAFVLSPTHRGKISNAKIIMQVGSHFEPWIDKLKVSSQQKKFILTDGLPLVNGDAHIWHSPDLTIQAARQIGAFFVENGIEKAEIIQKCTAVFEKSVAQEFSALKKQIQSIPVQDRILATDHDAFSYFGRDFGLKIVSVTGFAPDSSPTPLKMHKAIEQIKLKKIKAVFLEEGSTAKTLETLARETQIRIGGTLIADGLSGPGSGADTILGLWRKNISIFIEGINGLQK